MAGSPPRVREGRSGGALTFSREAGSPPRVREGHDRVEQLVLSVRITPACAGRTSSAVSLPNRFWDHPRVCGKDVGDRCRDARDTGSPPRVREGHTYVHAKRGWWRITPACAGRTVKDSLPIKHSHLLFSKIHSLCAPVH